MQLSDSAWPAAEGTDACWGFVTGATQAPGDIGKDIWSGLVLFEIFCLAFFLPSPCVYLAELICASVG